MGQPKVHIKVDPAMLAVQDEPWLKLPKEPDKPYAVFCAYRDMGAHRSLNRLASVLGINWRTLERWSSTYEWSFRANAFDKHADKMAADKIAKDHADMIVRHTSLGMALIGKAAERLRQLTIDEMTPLDVIRFVREGTKLERLSRGEPTEIVEEQRVEKASKDLHDQPNYTLQVIQIMQEAGGLPEGVTPEMMLEAASATYVDITDQQEQKDIDGDDDTE